KQMTAGDYLLLLTQSDGRAHPVGFQVLPPAPQITKLPLVLNSEEEQQRLVLKGDNLDRVVALETDAARLTLDPEGAQGEENQRTVRVQLKPGMEAGVTSELRAYVQNTYQPVVLPEAVKVAPPKPECLGSQLSLPPNTEVTLKRGELPAGGFVSASLRGRNVSATTKVRLRCALPGAEDLTIRVGDQFENPTS